MPTQDRFSQVVRDWSEVFMHRSLRDFRHWMEESDLSMSQINTLMRLYHQGTCGVSDIGAYLGVTNAASSQLIERLVQMDLLQRTEDPADRRAKQVTLSNRGRALVERGIDARRSWIEELTCNLSPEQQEHIADALTLLTEAAQALDKQSP